MAGCRSLPHPVPGPRPARRRLVALSGNFERFHPEYSPTASGRWAVGNVMLPEIDDNLKAAHRAPEELERQEAGRSPGSLPKLTIPACGAASTAIAANNHIN